MKKIGVEEHCLPAGLRAYMQSRTESTRRDVIEERRKPEQPGLISPQDRWRRMSRMGKIHHDRSGSNR